MSSCWSCIKADLTAIEERIASVVSKAIEASKPEILAAAKAAAKAAALAAIAEGGAAGAIGAAENAVRASVVEAAAPYIAGIRR